MPRKYRIVLIGLLVLIIIQTLPVFFLKPLGAKTMRGSNIILYYTPDDQKGAREIFDTLETSAAIIRGRLHFKSHRLTEVYVYANQPSLWSRKWGILSLIIAPHWFIGDNRGDRVMIISPYAKVKGYNPEIIKSAARHELVHTINYQINPDLSYWLDNGSATYLAGQVPWDGFARNFSIPSFNDLQSENQIRFGNIMGYQFSYTYIEYLDKTYGWNSVLQLIQGEKTSEEIFHKSAHDIYLDWVEYVKSKYC